MIHAVDVLVVLTQDVNVEQVGPILPADELRGGKVEPLAQVGVDDVEGDERVQQYGAQLLTPPHREGDPLPSGYASRLPFVTFASRRSDGAIFARVTFQSGVASVPLFSSAATFPSQTTRADWTNHSCGTKIVI